MTKFEALQARKKTLQQERKELREKLKNHRSTPNANVDVDATTARMFEINDEIDTINEDMMAESTRSRFPEGPTAPSQLTSENYRSSDRYRDAFFRSMINRNIAADDAEVMAFGKRAITSMDGGSVNSGGSYLVPTTTLNQIATMLARFGRVYAAINKYHFNGDVSLPIGALNSTTTESDGTVTLSFDFTEITINQQAIVVNIAVPNLLMRNAISALESYLAYEIGKYMGVQLDNYCLNANPASSKFKGIIFEIKEAPSAAKTYSEMDWPQIVEIQGAVDEPYGDNATWIMKRSTFFSQFKSLTDAEGRPLVQTMLVQVQGGRAQKQYYIDGDPVIFTSVMPDTDSMLYGDLDTYIINESQELVIESDTSVKFNEDKTNWRGKVYAGGKPMFAKSTFAYYHKAG